MNLKEMIGHEIHLVIELIQPAPQLMAMKLHNVEEGGIWVESQALTEIVLGIFQVPTAPKTLVIFLPWSQIRMIFGYRDAPSLSEKALGL